MPASAARRGSCPSASSTGSANQSSSRDGSSSASEAQSALRAPRRICRTQPRPAPPGSRPAPRACASIGPAAKAVPSGAAITAQ